VQTYVTRRIAVLNKIDLMWDDLKSDDQIEAGIERQLDDTAKILGLPRDHVIALSAQKGLVARIREDDELLARSRIGKLERLLAEEIIPSKQQILRAAVSREIGGMVETSLQSATAQLDSAKSDLQEMSKLSGKNRDLAKVLLAKLETDRANYLRHMESFKNSYGTVLKQGHVLLDTLSDEHLDDIMLKSQQSIEGSWTTAGLMRSMQALFDTFSRQAEKILLRRRVPQLRRWSVQRVPQGVRLSQNDPAGAQPRTPYPAHALAATEHRTLLQGSGQRHDREALPGAAFL
jgi:hypothetical protein